MTCLSRPSTIHLQRFPSHCPAMVSRHIITLQSFFAISLYNLHQLRRPRSRIRCLLFDINSCFSLNFDASTFSRLRSEFVCVDVWYRIFDVSSRIISVLIYLLVRNNIIGYKKYRASTLKKWPDVTFHEIQCNIFPTLRYNMMSDRCAWVEYRT